MLKRKQKAPNKKKVEESVLKLWSQVVRDRDKTCRICNSDYRLQAHHIRSRANEATKFLVQNGLTVCSKCHIQQKFNPEKFQDMVIGVIGNKEYQRLKKMSLTVMKYKRTIHDLYAIKDFLNHELGNLQKV